MARRRFSPVVRRKKVWADHESTGTTLAEDAAATVDVLAGFITAGGSIQGTTVIRTLIDMVWYPTAAVVAGDKFTIGLIHNPTGLAGVPDPITEPYADWGYVRTLYAGADTGLLAAGAPWVSHHDVHSMRKMDELGSSWFFCGIYTAPGSATTANYKARIRTLLLLPLGQCMCICTCNSASGAIADRRPSLGWRSPFHTDVYGDHTYNVSTINAGPPARRAQYRRNGDSEMLKPEPGLKLDLGYYELGELQRTLTIALSDYPYIGAHASERIKPILRKINEFLEAVDGS